MTTMTAQAKKAQAKATQTDLETHLATMVVEAKKVVIEAQAQLAKAFTRFKNETGLPSAYAQGGEKVTVVEGTRRNYDVEALRDAVPADVFAKVTRDAVDTEKWDSAISLGLISNDTIAAVVTGTDYSYPRVSGLSE